jgi:hypothetical protein
MLKFLAILFIVSYVTFKLGGFLMKALNVAAGRDPNQNSKKQSRKSADGNVNIDYVPNDKKDGDGYKGGEYVDYEDVK